MQRSVRIILFVCCFLFLKTGFTQDIRGGYLEYKWLSGYTYSITAVILTDDNINPSNHCMITIYFGDGDSAVVYRENGPLSAPTSQCLTSHDGVLISTTPVIRQSIYSTTHTFNGPGLYKGYFSEFYRINGIKNITFSDVRSILINANISVDPFRGPSSSPAFPASNYSVTTGSLFNLNMGLSDPDGDSLSYELISCIPPPQTQYYIPSNSGINSTTGTFTFQADTAGFFAFKFLVKEWRTAQLIGLTETDFLVEVIGSIGIKEYSLSKLILAPNPASGYLTVKNVVRTTSEIEIINYLGQTVLKQKYSETIDISKLSPGCYFIRIGDSYSKFIKE